MGHEFEAFVVPTAKKKHRLVDVAVRAPNGLRRFDDPRYAVAQNIADAMDPDKAVQAPRQCRTLADMGEAERKALEERYGAKIATAPQPLPESVDGLLERAWARRWDWKERKFIASARRIAAAGFSLSDKQIAWLKKIASRPAI